MRELPERIRDSDKCTIRLNHSELVLIDIMLDGAVASYGDGESFSWISGGGEFKYRGTRSGRANAFDDGTPMSTWLLEIEDLNQNLLHSYVFDGSQEEPFRLLDGSPIPFYLVNMTYNLAVDLQEEEAALRTTMPYRILPNGYIIANPWYKGDV